MEILDWLLDSDPSIRWQAIRDLTDASPAVLQRERNRLASEGPGAEILASQQTDGARRRDDAPVWLTTLFTQLLRATGVDSADPLRGSQTVWLSISLRTAAGTARRRKAGAPPFTQRSVCWKDYSSTAAQSDQRRRSRQPGAAARSICLSELCFGGSRRADCASELRSIRVSAQVSLRRTSRS